MNRINHNLIYLLLFGIASITLIPFIFTGFSNGDDLSYYLAVRAGKIWHNASIYAKDQGRFYYLFTIPLAQLCYRFDNYLVPKSLNILFVLINFTIIGFIIKEVFNNKWTGFLCFILLNVFVSIKGAYNPIVSYPLYFTVSFSFILLSIYFVMQFKKTAHYKFLTVSVIIYAIGLLFYESYLMYLPLLIIISYNVSSDKKSLKSKKIKFIIPYIVIGVAYCIVYFSYRLVNPSNYSGSSFSGNFSFSRFFDTVLNFTSGSYPLALAFTEGLSTFGGADYFLHDKTGNIFYTIVSEHTCWLLKSVIISILVYLSTRNLENLRLKTIIIVFIGSLFYIFLPQIPLSLSEKYLSAGGIPNYVTTYFSFLAAVICLATIIIFLNRITRFNKQKYFLMIFLSIFIGLISILNDYANYHAIKALQVPLNVFKVVDEFVKTNEYDLIPENSFIYSPELYDEREDIIHFTNLYNWSYYFSLKGNKNVTVSYSKDLFIEELDRSKSDIYYLNYGRNQFDLDQYLIVSAIKDQSQVNRNSGQILSDSAKIFYYSKNKTFTIRLNTDHDNLDNTLIINEDTFTYNHNCIDLNVTNMNYKNKFVTINIKSNNIDLKKIILSNIALTNGIPVLLD